VKIHVPRMFACEAVVLATIYLAPGVAQLRAEQNANVPAVKETFRTVQDETGRSIRLPVPIRRVVSLAPSMTESIYALGMDDLLVGDTDYCDYPAAAAKKHKVGGAINPSLEEIAALKPDVVLVTKGLNRLDTVQALERLGIAAYATDPHTIDEIRGSVLRLAEVLGNRAAGEVLDNELLRKETDLQQRLQSSALKRVLFVVWTNPLISIGRHTFIADALSHAGAVSVVESSQDWPQMSLEEMVRLQPEVLVFASNHSEGVSRDMEALAKRPGWNQLDAVKYRRFAVISDAVNRPAPRLLSAVEDLARQLHPEAFAEKGSGSSALPAVEKN
jgi:iron complex transport system substrate-binding protein